MVKLATLVALEAAIVLSYGGNITFLAIRWMTVFSAPGNWPN